jgi:hypothetical protein
MLVDAEPGQLVVEYLALLLGEVAVLEAPSIVAMRWTSF